MADPAGTKRTAYAAGWDGELFCPGDTYNIAISRAIEDLTAQIEREDADPHGTYTVQVYHDVLWCIGDDGREDCHCGTGHDDHAWLMMTYDHWTKHRLVVVLDADDYVERIDVGDEITKED